ncbi:hypothetical protein LCGC14_2417330 [marine sediment metagenome]|uniref:Uncharacterized protein n=1 Tax=marine sediment metagenome TaxID=412755 RepID=A0A0F9BQS6_9ZZZZ
MSQHVILLGHEWELTEAEILEMEALGVVERPRHCDPASLKAVDHTRMGGCGFRHKLVEQIEGVTLNEAPIYGSSFSRAVVMHKNKRDLVFVSGTAAVDESGATKYQGNFGAQLWRTYRNITGLLDGANSSWYNVVKTTCYLRDIDRDYKAFNSIRTLFYNWMGLQPYPASVGIQAVLCRPDLLVEIEVLALTHRGGPQ